MLNLVLKILFEVKEGVNYDKKRGRKSFFFPDKLEPETAGNALVLVQHTDKSSLKTFFVTISLPKGNELECLWEPSTIREPVKKGIIWEFFPTGGGGGLLNPFVI